MLLTNRRSFHTLPGSLSALSSPPTTSRHTRQREKKKKSAPKAASGFCFQSHSCWNGVSVCVGRSLSCQISSALQHQRRPWTKGSRRQRERNSGTGAGRAACCDCTSQGGTYTGIQPSWVKTRLWLAVCPLANKDTLIPVLSFTFPFILTRPSVLRLSCGTQTSFLILYLSDEMSDDDCLSPIGLDCCNCCLDLANGCVDGMSTSPSQGLGSAEGLPASPSSPSVNHFRQLRNQLMYHNLNTDKLNNIMRQDSLESVVRDPCFLLNEGICNSNIDQTMLSILLFFHRYVVVPLSVING